MCCVLVISVASKVRNCAVPPGNLHGAISFLHTSSILNLIRRLHIAYRFVQNCRIFLEGTLLAIRNASFVFLQVFFILLIVHLRGYVETQVHRQETKFPTPA